MLGINLFLSSIYFIFGVLLDVGNDVLDPGDLLEQEFKKKSYLLQGRDNYF